jgi:hypothetical protein
MCSGGGDEPASGDEIDCLARAIESMRARVRDSAPEVVRHDLVRLRRAIDRIELEFSAVAAIFANTDEEEWQGSGSPTQWLRGHCGMTSAAASRAIVVGDEARVLTQSHAAVEEGKLGFTHLSLMAGTASALRESLTATVFQEQPLLDLALTHNLSRFRNDCAHLRHAHDVAAFQAEQRRDVEYRTVEVHVAEGGAVFIKGFLDPVGGAMFCAALEPLARRAGADDDRLRGRRNADALVELSGHGLDAGVLPRVGGQRPHLQVTASIETLIGQPGAPAGMLDRAGPVATATVQRLACDTSLTRVLLNSQSAIVDVGRARRLPSGPTRRALLARYGGCAWPGCDRPAAWTAAHHLTPWSHGGATNLDNLVLICHRHHWMVHEGGWTLVRGAGGEMLSVAPVARVASRARSPDATPSE